MLGAFQPSRFTLPENPITRAYEPCGGLGAFIPAPWRSLQGGVNAHDCGCGCNGAGTCGGGLGDLAALDFDLSGITDTLTQPVIGGIPLWAVAGGAVLALLMLTGRGSSQSDYQRELSALKQKYPTRGRRYATAAKRGYAAGRSVWD